MISVNHYAGKILPVGAEKIRLVMLMCFWNWRISKEIKLETLLENLRKSAAQLRKTADSMRNVDCPRLAWKGVIRLKAAELNADALSLDDWAKRVEDEIKWIDNQ